MFDKKRLINMSNQWSEHGDFEVLIESQKRLQDHRLIPEHGPILSENPQFRRKGKVVRVWNVMNVGHNANVQDGEHFQV